MDNLKNKMTEILKNKNTSIVIYFKLNNKEIVFADINKNVLPEIMISYRNEINRSIVDNSEITLCKLSLADSRNNVLYEYDFTEKSEPFVDFETMIKKGSKIDIFSFSDNKLSDINAIIAKIHNSENQMYFYSKIYSLNIVKRSKFLKLINSANGFNKFDEELILLTGKFDFFRIDKLNYVKNLEVLEKNYNFHSVIKERTSRDFKTIIDKHLLVDDEILSIYLNKTISRSRKFIKMINSSKVIKNNISNENIINFIQNNQKLKSKLKISEKEKKIELQSDKSCEFFIKLLDDDFLKSTLTNEEYDAIDKNNM